MRERTIASHFARAALGGARRSGFDYSPLLQRLGISPELLDEPRARIAPEQFTQLIQSLWLALDDEYLGFGNVPSKPGSFAMMCHALIHCRNLEKALQRGLLFYSLFPGAPRLDLSREDEWVRLSLDDSQLWDPDHFLSESLLVIWHRLGSWLIGQRIRLEQATFSYPKPAHGAEYDLLFPCPLVFAEGRSSLLFHSRYLHMPLLQDERTLKHFLERSPPTCCHARTTATVSAAACAACSVATAHTGRIWKRWPRTCTSARKPCVGICVRKAPVFRN